jgi:hypothetical protein
MGKNVYYRKESIENEILPANEDQAKAIAMAAEGHSFLLTGMYFWNFDCIKLFHLPK